MVCVFIYLVSLAFGKHGLRTLGIRALFVYWVTMVVAIAADVAATVTAGVQLRRPNSAYRNDAFAIGAFYVYVALVVILLLANCVGIALAVHLIGRMKEFSFQDRLVFLGQLTSDAAPLGGAGDAPPMRVLSARPAAISMTAAARSAAAAADGGASANLGAGAAIELQSIDTGVDAPPPIAKFDSGAADDGDNAGIVASRSAVDAPWCAFDASLFRTNALYRAKYNVATFLPIFLFNQFSRLANLYTLGVVCLCFFSFSPLRPEASMVPLLIVLVSTALKEVCICVKPQCQACTMTLAQVKFEMCLLLSLVTQIFEDSKRRTQDREVNERRVERVQPADASISADGKPECIFASCCWQDVRVGDVVRVERDQYFPADMVLLACSTDTGRCYVETAQLDGESNLKLRFAVKATSDLETAADFGAYQLDVQCEPPNNKLYVFDGAMQVTHLDSLRQHNVALGAEQMLLRGTRLKHNEWCVGLVVNTGLDTKIEQNSTATPHKQSRMERSVNLKLIFIFLLQTALCITCSLGYNRFKLRDAASRLPKYLDPDASSTGFIYGSYVILFNSMIPLSMCVERIGHVPNRDVFRMFSL